MIESQPTPQHPALRVAAGFCALDGLLSLVIGVLVVRDVSSPWTIFGVDVALALLMFGAAVLLWRRHLIGAVLILLAYALRASFEFMANGKFQGPSLLMVLAMLVLAFNARTAPPNW